jgi:hypothetical protein
MSETEKPDTSGPWGLCTSVDGRVMWWTPVGVEGCSYHQDEARTWPTETDVREFMKANGTSWDEWSAVCIADPTGAIARARAEGEAAGYQRGLAEAAAAHKAEVDRARSAGMMDGIERVYREIRDRAQYEESMARDSMTRGKVMRGLLRDIGGSEAGK